MTNYHGGTDFIKNEYSNSKIILQVNLAWNVANVSWVCFNLPGATCSLGNQVRLGNSSEKHQCTTIIKMERTLEKKDHAVVAKVSYKRSSTEREGKWLFFGWAAC